MNESYQSHESKEVIAKESVISAYKKFVERGITSPDQLDLSDPEVQKADELFYKWQAQEDKQAEGGEEAQYRANLAKTMLYIDAGFTDSEYLKDVQGWLFQDARDVEKQEENPERAKTRKQVADALRKVRNLLNEAK